jgi:hypothetical protein
MRVTPGEQTVVYDVAGSGVPGIIRFPIYGQAGRLQGRGLAPGGGNDAGLPGRAQVATIAVQIAAPAALLIAARVFHPEQPSPWGDRGRQHEA